VLSSKKVSSVAGTRCVYWVVQTPSLFFDAHCFDCSTLLCSCESVIAWVALCGRKSVVKIVTYCARGYPPGPSVVHRCCCPSPRPCTLRPELVGMSGLHAQISPLPTMCHDAPPPCRSARCHAEARSTHLALILRPPSTPQPASHHLQPRLSRCRHKGRQQVTVPAHRVPHARITGRADMGKPSLCPRRHKGRPQPRLANAGTSCRLPPPRRQTGCLPRAPRHPSRARTATTNSRSPAL